MGNNIRELREKTGLNRKEFSELTDIPYMTLTDWELNKHDAPPYVHRLLEYYIRLNKLTGISDIWNVNECHVWEEQKNYRTTFPITIPSTIVPVQFIYPTKQKTAIEINNKLSDMSDVVSVMLFGSSVSMRCTSSSDTDLSIRLLPEKTDVATKNVVSEIVQDICNYDADIIWFDKLTYGSKLYNNIMKGVQIV